MCHKILSGFLLLFVIIGSCRKQKDDGPKYYLAKEEYQFTGNPVYEYTYDADYRLKTVSFSGAPLATAWILTVNAYNDKGQISVLNRHYATAGSVDRKILYQYNDQGKLSAVEEYTVSAVGNTNLDTKKIFTYSGRKTTVVWLDMPAADTINRSEYIQDEAGNIIQRLVYASTGTLTTTEYSSFDNHPSYAAKLPAEYCENPVSTHNPGIGIKKNAAGATTGVDVFTYEYDEDGLPVKQTTSFGVIANSIKYTYIKR